VLLSLGDFVDALHLLEREEDAALAAVFARVLSEEGLLEPSVKPSALP